MTLNNSKMTTRRLNKCNFCGDKVEISFRIKKMPVFTGVLERMGEKLDFGLAVCKSCGLVQQVYSKKLDIILNNVYKSKNAVLSTPLGVGNWGKQRLRQFLKTAEIKVKKDAEILKIGSGQGGLLYELFCKGYRNLSCFEPSVRAKTSSNKNIGFSPDIYNDFFSLQAVNKYKLIKKYDLIISTAVLEHIKNLKDFLDGIRLALKENGLVIITVPNELFSLKKNDPGLMVHEHLNYFTPKNVKTILSLTGFIVTSLKVRKDTLLVKFRKTGGGSSGVSGVLISSLVKQNRELLRDYFIKMKELVNNFRIIMDRSEKIGLYGACATVVNLLYLSKTYRYKNYVFIDSDSRKWYNKLFGTIVIPPYKIVESEANRILIIPPAFQKEIAKNIGDLNLSRTIKVIKFWKK